MRKVLLFLLILEVLTLTACRSKLSPEGVYTFSDHPISVRAPQECGAGLLISDKSNVVDFGIRYYWELSGQWFVIVFDIPDGVTDAPSFINRIKPWFTEEFQPNESEFFKMDWEVVDEYEMTVNGDPAYRVVFEDPGKGILVGTARLHRQHMTITALAYSLEKITKADVPWDCYEDFVKSVSETPDT